MEKVLFVSGIDGDSRRYRCLHHQEQLALHGIVSDLREANDLQLYVDATLADLFILHRVSYSPLIADLIEIAHARGKPVIFETDDLIFEPELYAKIAFVDTLSPEAAHRFRQNLYAQAETFAHSDYVLTTTQYLAAAAAKHNKMAYVHRNAFSNEMVRNAEVAYASHRGTIDASGAETLSEKKVTIGYFSGTGSHNRDFAMITPALLAIMHRYPQVWLHVSGQLELDMRFQAYRERIRRAPFVAWQELPQLIAQVDINLAPLELDNPFCQAKSEIKYTEAALVGAPTVASPTDAFAYAITHGENGLLAASNEEWQAALSQLIEQPEVRKQLGERARMRVYQEYAPQVRSQALVETLQAIRATYAPVDANPAQVALIVARAMKRYLDEMTKLQQQQEKQLRGLRQTIAEWEAQRNDVGRDFWQRHYEMAQQQHTVALQSVLARLQRERV